MVDIQQKQEYFDFINEILGVKFDPKMAICMASLSSSGDILGVVVYDRFTTTGVELSVASVSPRFLTKDFLDAVFHYPFVTCGKTRVTAVIEEDNHRAMRLNTGLGFVSEAKLKCWYGNKDGIILRMLRDECRWVRAINREKTNKDNNNVSTERRESADT